MKRYLKAACAVGLLTLTVQLPLRAQALPADVAQIPQEIKSLQWQAVDLNAVTPLEYDRALLLLNHVLDEVSPVRASEADLMSAYIDAQNLGAEFAATPPPANAASPSYNDVVKIAVAMLRGPMASSSYASELAGSQPSALTAYRQMYESTCQRRWSEIAEALHQTRCMGTFIQNKGKMQDYQTWAKLEAENRKLKYELEMSQKTTAEAAKAAHPKAAPPPQQPDPRLAQMEQANEQLQQALMAAQQQQQQQAAQANQQQQQQQQQAESSAPSTSYYAPAYGIPAYYGANYAWCHSTACANASREETENRYSNWHGTPGVNHANAAAAGLHNAGRR